MNSASGELYNNITGSSIKNKLPIISNPYDITRSNIKDKLPPLHLGDKPRMVESQPARRPQIRPELMELIGPYIKTVEELRAHENSGRENPDMVRSLLVDEMRYGQQVFDGFKGHTDISDDERSLWLYFSRYARM